MSTTLIEAQLTLLARALEVPAEQIASLRRLGPHGLHALRKSVSGYLFDELDFVFARVSKLAPLVPDALVATVAEQAWPPLVAGRAAGALGADHPHRVNGILARLSPHYMADAAPAIDPRVLPIITPGLNTDLLLPAIRILLTRKDFESIAEILACVEDESLLGNIIAVFDDEPHDLIQVLAYIPSDSWIDTALRRLPRQRVVQALTAATTVSAAHWVAALSTFPRLKADLRNELANELAANVTDAELPTLVETAIELDALNDLRVLIEALPLAQSRRFDLILSPIVKVDLKPGP